jgi:galactonate dehydratase
MRALSGDQLRSRRKFFKKTFAASMLAALGGHSLRADNLSGGEPSFQSRQGDLKITRLETFKVKPRFLFLKIHTDAGIIGLGEPITEGRADTCAVAVQEIAPYLVGQDPRRIMHHWQAIYRHTFYRGGPILTSALSGIEQALWDIKGQALGVPIYELLGGPTRQRIRVYAHARTPERIAETKAQGYTAFKTGVLNATQSGIVASPKFIEEATAHFISLREAVGDDADIGIDFHGAISAPNAELLIHALEPHKPFFHRRAGQLSECRHHGQSGPGDPHTDRHGRTCFYQWGFREILEKGAATILQPDLCHAGGIFEGRIIAGMAEAYYASVAPHNPLGPISLAAGIQLAASIPNFLCQEQVTLGEGYLKEPFVVKAGHVDLPTKPGLGIELDDAALADKLGHEWRNPETYLESDGSVVDW